MKKSILSVLGQKAQLGICIAYPAAGIVERIGPDWDWIWLDAQHGQLEYKDILEMVRVCDVINKPVIVRSESHDAGVIGKYLDVDIDGIMIPMVESAQQARKLVEAVKFPPLGKRSYGGRRSIDKHGRGYAHNVPPVLICQIESSIGMENAEDIIAADGVDALFFGADDMALCNGMRMDAPRDKCCFDNECQKICKLAEKYGKIAGGVFTSPEAVEKSIQMGFSLIVIGGDVGFMASASSRTKELYK